jgi:hypothetical protein
MSVGVFSGGNFINSLQTAGKNLIINGGMDVWQRGTSIALGATQAYTADRWYSYRGGVVTGCTVSRQVSSLTGIQYCARIARTAGDTSTQALTYQYNAETVDSYRFAGQTVNLSFYIRAGANFSATSNLLSYTLQYGTGTDQTLANGLTGQTAAISTTATLTTSWQRVTASAAIPSTATQVAMSFTYTPTGTAGANDYFEITGVQLELGSTATTFSRSAGNIQGELAACQRYYYRVTSGVAYAMLIPTGVSTSSTLFEGFLTHPVTMRIAPNVLEFSTLYAAQRTTTSSDQVITAGTLGAVTTNTGTLVFTVASGLTTNASGTVRSNNSATAYFALSSEL